MVKIKFDCRILWKMPFRQLKLQPKFICSIDLSFSAYCRLYLRSSTANWKRLIVDGNNYIKSNHICQLSWSISSNANTWIMAAIMSLRGTDLNILFPLLLQVGWYINFRMEIMIKYPLTGCMVPVALKIFNQKIC